MIQQESRLVVADNSGAKEAIRLAGAKLPIKTKFVSKQDSIDIFEATVGPKKVEESSNAGV